MVIKVLNIICPKPATKVYELIERRDTKCIQTKKK